MDHVLVGIPSGGELSPDYSVLEQRILDVLRDGKQVNLDSPYGPYPPPSGWELEASPSVAPTLWERLSGRGRAVVLMCPCGHETWHEPGAAALQLGRPRLCESCGWSRLHGARTVAWDSDEEPPLTKVELRVQKSLESLSVLLRERLAEIRLRYERWKLPTLFERLDLEDSCP